MPDNLDRCWRQIGVSGDASCARLAEVGHCRNCDEYARVGRGLLDREISASLREGWSRLLAEAKPSVAAGAEAAVVFQVCGEYFGVRTVLFDRVIETRTVHTVPSRSGTVFRGLINLDGELLPCFSVAAALRLGECRPTPDVARILVLSQGEARLACLVDQVVGLVRLSAGELETPPVTLSRDDRAFTMAVFSLKGKRAGLLDGVKFVQSLMKTAGI